MKKKLLIVSMVVLICHTLIAQKKTEQYCEVNVVSNFRAANIIDIKIDSGYAQPVQDSIIVSYDELSVIKERNSISGLLNFMAGKGWTLISTLYLPYPPNGRRCFYFKKSF